MRNLKILFLISLFAKPSFAAPTCNFQLDPATVKIEWTAFKTTEKTPVRGQVKDFQVDTSTKGMKSLKSLLLLTRVQGAFDSDKKSDSTNPARDLTLFQKFFSLFAAKGKFDGSLNHIKGDDQKGELHLALKLNSKSKTIPMQYTLSLLGDFAAVGEFDMLDFNLKAAHDSIHTACLELHKGKDGVSKTWTNVGVVVTAKIKKECAEK